MEKQIQKVLIRLRKISKIPEGGRLDTTSGDIELYDDGWVNWAYRTIKGDGRKRTMEALRTFYQEIIQLNKDLMKADMANPANLESIYKQLLESQTGLINIKECPKYRADSSVSSVIEFIIQDLLPPHMTELQTYLKSKGVTIAIPIPKLAAASPPIEAKTEVKQDDAMIRLAGILSSLVFGKSPPGDIPAKPDAKPDAKPAQSNQLSIRNDEFGE